MARVRKGAQGRGARMHKGVGRLRPHLRLVGGEQVKGATSRDLDHREKAGEGVGLRGHEQRGRLLDAAHGERLARARLAIHEDRRAAALLHVLNQRADAALANGAGVVGLAEGFDGVAAEVVVHDDHAPQVGVHHRMVHHHAPGRGHAHTIELALGLLVGKERPLARQHAHAPRRRTARRRGRRRQRGEGLKRRAPRRLSLPRSPGEDGRSEGLAVHAARLPLVDHHARGRVLPLGLPVARLPFARLPFARLPVARLPGGRGRAVARQAGRRRRAGPREARGRGGARQRRRRGAR